MTSIHDDSFTPNEAVEGPMSPAAKDCYRRPPHRQRPGGLQRRRRPRTPGSMWQRRQTPSLVAQGDPSLHCTRHRPSIAVTYSACLVRLRRGSDCLGPGQQSRRNWSKGNIILKLSGTCVVRHTGMSITIPVRRTTSRQFAPPKRLFDAQFSFKDRPLPRDKESCMGVRCN